MYYKLTNNIEHSPLIIHPQVETVTYLSVVKSPIYIHLLVYTTYTSVKNENVNRLFMCGVALLSMYNDNIYICIRTNTRTGRKSRCLYDGLFTKTISHIRLKYMFQYQVFTHLKQ